MKKSFAVPSILCASLAGFSTQASATVSAMTDIVTPYETIQDEKVCLMKAKMIGEYGIPLASEMEGIFGENRIRQQIFGSVSPFVNINLLAGSTPITWTLDSDGFSGSVWSFTFSLDFGALAAANGFDVAGRQKTVDTAKLAVVSVNMTAKEIFGAGNYSVKLNLDNLPTQSGLSGSYLYPTTSYPYSSSSPLLASYKSEMIDGDCPTL